jgi:hypothetical protein
MHFGLLTYMNGAALYIIMGADSSYTSVSIASLGVQYSMSNTTPPSTYMLCKHVPHRAPRDRQERRPRQPVQKSRNQHRLDVACQRARYQPDEEEAKGREVDGAPAVELGSLVVCALKKDLT